MFFLANRKQIINPTGIEKAVIGMTGGLTAVLRGGQSVEISRRRADRLRTVLSL